MFARLSSAASVPCAKCNKEEFEILHQAFAASDGKFWVYNVDASVACSRCDNRSIKATWNRAMKAYGRFITQTCCDTPYVRVQIPIDMTTVGIVERSIHASSIATKGSENRSHGTFISHLVTLECEEEYKQALCTWAPSAMMSFMNGKLGASRCIRRGRLWKPEAPPLPPPPPVEDEAPQAPPAFRPPPGLEIKADEGMLHLQDTPANSDCAGEMIGTQVDADAYGAEDRVKGTTTGVQGEKVHAVQIGPDLIPAEAMANSENNLKAGLAKRVQPLPFKSDKKMIRKINSVVNALMKHVFSKEKIKAWRKEHPCVEEFGSKKWSSERFNQALEDALSDTAARIEQTFQIKKNECLPAKDKAPRPIIQCGDRAQVMMSLPVKCFEELLFEHFEEASIKHVGKYEAMERIAKRFRDGKEKLHIVEGDGSAWDACCNSRIRSLTENRILRHIISVLGDDHEVPKAWFDNVINDMEKEKIRGKAKVEHECLTPIRVVIDSIRQSGHRGTSCFNYLINLVCWLCVLCEDPQSMIAKDHGKLPTKYVSPRDEKEYKLVYAFEGDDSAICTTEDLSSSSETVEKAWTDMGFRMKLVYVKKKMTFTGFDFLCDEKGATGLMLPEVVRNIASSSWSCSPEIISFPERKNKIGAAAMLARAENFQMCGAFSKYFASLGLAHLKTQGDFGIEEAEALKLGINKVDSVKARLQELYDGAGPMCKDMFYLVNQVFPFSRAQEFQLLEIDFDDPFDLELARRVIPFTVWDPKKFSKPRRARR